MLSDRTAMATALLPDDPEDGQIYELPENQSVGGANVIYVFKGKKQIGTAQELSAVHNVSRRYVLTRFSCSTPVTKGDIIRIRGVQYNYKALRFIQYFGWVGEGYVDPPMVLQDKTYRVVDAVTLGDKGDQHILYERVCVELITGADK